MASAFTFKHLQNVEELKVNCRDFVNAVQDFAAITAVNLHPTGLLSNTLPTAEFEAIYGEPAAGVGPFILVNIADYAFDQHPANMRDIQYKILDKFNTDTTARRLCLINLKKAILDALPESIKIRFTLPSGREDPAVQVHHIVSHLQDTYCTLSATDISTLKSELQTPFVHSSTHTLTTHFAGLTKIFRRLEANGHGMREYEQFDIARQSITLYTPLSLAMSVFTTTYPLPAQQIFATFTEAMELAEANRIPTSASAGYALTVITDATKLASALARISSLETENKALLAQIKAQKTAWRQAFGATPPQQPATPGPAPLSYCWTHGTTFHNSSTCKHPATGHQPTATAANKMGGKP